MARQLRRLLPSGQQSQCQYPKKHFVIRAHVPNKCKSEHGAARTTPELQKRLNFALPWVAVGSPETSNVSGKTSTSFPLGHTLPIPKRCTSAGCGKCSKPLRDDSPGTTVWLNTWKESQFTSCCSLCGLLEQVPVINFCPHPC